MPHSLVLASTSSYRKSQLSQLVTGFHCLAPGVDETPRQGELPEQLSLRLSLAKARAVLDRAPDDALIIAGDQCAALEGEILGKPHTAERARAQLAACSGRQVRFHSGLCVLNKQNGDALCDSVLTRVSFRQLSDKEIDSYIKREQPLDCAGSFKCESLGICLFEHIHSDDPSALMGLPLIQLNRFLLSLGFNALFQQAE